jgi:hypothetical protein
MKKMFITGIFCLLFCCVSVTAAFLGANGGDWSYGREITVRETSGTMLDFFSLPITLDASNFDFSKANPDGSDIRITDHEGYERALWTEEWNATARHAMIWISVPRIPAKGEAVMRLYYGNPKAISTSNGGATFLFFDDFTSPELSSESWIRVAGDVKQETGYLRLPSGNAQVSSMIPFTRPVAVRFRYRTSDGRDPSADIVSILAQQDFRYGGKAPAYSMKLLTNHDPSRSGGFTLGNDLQSLGGAAQASFDATGWNSYDLMVSEDSIQGIWGGSSGPVMRDASLLNGKLSLTTTCTSACKGSADWDWIAVRKFARIEPAVTLSSEYPASQLIQKMETRTQTPGPTSSTKSPGFVVIPACLALILVLILVKRDGEK